MRLEVIGELQIEEITLKPGGGDKPAELPPRLDEEPGDSLTPATNSADAPPSSRVASVSRERRRGRVEGPRRMVFGGGRRPPARPLSTPSAKGAVLLVGNGTIAARGAGRISLFKSEASYEIGLQN